ncbi:MAG: Arc family DNA-binding protein [Rhizobiales bacterium]|nr:Arc family DNA-binding protein [Hyphomicrobiales bacterium]
MAKPGDDYQGNDPRYPSQQQDRFIVRLPDGMRDDLKVEAAKNGRSMNAEIVSRLVEYDSLRKQIEMLHLKLDRAQLSRDLLQKEMADVSDDRKQLAVMRIRYDEQSNIVNQLISIIAQATSADPHIMQMLANAIRKNESSPVASEIAKHVEARKGTKSKKT